MSTTIARSIGRVILKACRWLQWRALGLRVPAYRIREADLERQIFQADDRIRLAEADLAYWRAHLATLESQMDHAWRDSLALSRKIDAARGIVKPSEASAVKQSLTTGCGQPSA